MTKEDVVSKALNLIDALNSLPDDTDFLAASIDNDFFLYPKICGIGVQVSAKTAPESETFCSPVEGGAKVHYLCREDLTISWVTREEADKNG